MKTMDTWSSSYSIKTHTIATQQLFELNTNYTVYPRQIAAKQQRQQLLIVDTTSDKRDCIMVVKESKKSGGFAKANLYHHMQLVTS